MKEGPRRETSLVPAEIFIYQLSLDKGTSWTLPGPEQNTPAQARNYYTAHLTPLHVRLVFPTRVFSSWTQVIEGLEDWAESSKRQSPSLHSQRQRFSKCGSLCQHNGFLVSCADSSPTRTYAVRNSGCGPAPCGCTSPRVTLICAPVCEPLTELGQSQLGHCVAGGFQLSSGQAFTTVFKKSYKMSLADIC